MDLDGLKDIFSTTTGAYGAPDRARLWIQEAQRHFSEVGIPVGLLTANGPGLHGPAWVDLDGDGDLDLVAGDTATAQLHIYRNNVGQDQNWLRVRVVGRGLGASNSSAIGAVVGVTTGSHTQTQYVSGGYGHANVEADLVLTFGLGASCTVDHVEVRWPDATATVTSYNNVSPNHEVVIREGDPEVEYRR